MPAATEESSALQAETTLPDYEEGKFEGFPPQPGQKLHRSNTSGDEERLRSTLSSSTSSLNRGRIVRRGSNLKRFSDVDSTEDQFSIDKPYYGGPYAHIRKELDYTYHKHYSKCRQWLQDSIIEDMLEDSNVSDEDVCVTPYEPWMIFTVGPRGAGKRHTVDELVLDERLPLLGFIRVDSDEIRRRLPEFDTYAQSHPDLVDQLTRKESGYIAEILTHAAVQLGRNVIIDGVLKNTEWYLKLITKMKNWDESGNKNPSKYKIGIFVVKSPMDQILGRIAKKEIDTGRYIPQICTEHDIESMEEGFQILKPHVDYTCEIFNGKGHELELLSVSGNGGTVGDDDYDYGNGETKTNDNTTLDWDTDFTDHFVQMCAWKPGMKGKQKMRTTIAVSIVETQNTRKSMIQRSSRISTRPRFSVMISSEENNRMDDLVFYGRYSHIRKTLDYNYHCNYTFERQMLQDAIITDMLDAAYILDEEGNIGTVPTEPFIVFTAGAMGAGKGYTMNKLVEKGRFPAKAFVIVDPDEVRRLLPEYSLYIHANAELAGELTRKEAGFIAEILTLAALQAGKNVLQDGSLRDSDWYQTYFKRLKKEFPDVRHAILHVTAPREAIFQRAASRAITTGRVVPRQVLEMALEQTPRSVKILAPLVDYFAEFNNDQTSTDIELVKPENTDWDTFRSVWNQKVAYTPSRRKVLDKAKKELSSNGVIESIAE